MSNLALKDKKIEFKPTPQQTAAMEHEGSDLIISAGSGSGKTATLTDRIVNRICEKKMDISRMLVVTYTKDAANELKVRISKKLSERLKSDPTNTHICSQIIKVTSADISTIHSFCLKCMRPYFDKLSLDSDFRIGEESELDILRSEAMSQVIDSFYEAETIDKDFLIVSDCYSDFTNEEELGKALLKLYKDLISTSSGLELLIEPVDESGDFLETKYGKVLVIKLERLVSHFLPLVNSMLEDIKGDELATTKYLDTFADLQDKLLRLENALKSPKYSTIRGIFDSYAPVSFNGKRGIPQIDVELMTEIRDGVKNSFLELRDTYFCADEEAVKSALIQNTKSCHAIYKILKEFDKAYKIKKRKYALCDFNDLERYTLELFYNEDKTISNIAKEVSLKYDELYIDEYQDNNSVQDRIFSAISRNNRFMVGDIKQSIYSFRSAEPELFSSYRDSFIPYDIACKNENMGRSIFMSDNFRCDKSVIDFTNDVSDYMFSCSRGFNYVTEDRLNHSKLYNGTHEPQNAELILIDKAKIQKGSYFEEHDVQAELVAQKIKDLIDNGRLPNGEKITAKHIAILLRKKSKHAQKYIDALNRYGINNEYVQDTNFYELPHISLMLCILNAIDNPSKDVYLAGALLSSVFKFSLEDLVKIKKHTSSDSSLYANLLSFDGDEIIKGKIDSAINRLNEFRVGIKKMSAEQAISYIITETGICSYCNKEERKDIIRLYNIARSYESISYKGLYSFLRYVDDISKKGLRKTFSSDPEDSVKIVTMHSSKGLEYEICFLCDTEKSFFKSGGAPSILFDKNLGVCGYVGREDGVVKYNNLVRKCASLAIKDGTIEEAMRLLYVAMTRARSKLYITATLTNPHNFIASAQSATNIRDEYSVYSKSSHIGIILGACPYPTDYLDVHIVDPNDIVIPNHYENDLQDISVEKVKEYEEVLKERFDFSYDYSYLEKIPSKLSVSTLYPEVLDDEDNSEYRRDYTIEAEPKFMLEREEEASAAEKGTATHVFLQFCDFDNLIKNGTSAELERLVEKEFISKEVGKNINSHHIDKFITSSLLKDFLNAKQVIREFRFNIMLDAKEFSKNEELKDEKVLVQGVTDCIYENENGELILVDYKTDNVTESNYVGLLTKKHKTQLTYYKKACEMMFERPIARVLIYSVPLAKTVEIK